MRRGAGSPGRPPAGVGVRFRGTTRLRLTLHAGGTSGSSLSLSFPTGSQRPCPAWGCGPPGHPPQCLAFSPHGSRLTEPGEQMVSRGTSGGKRETSRDKLYLPPSLLQGQCAFWGPLSWWEGRQRCRAVPKTSVWRPRGDSEQCPPPHCTRNTKEAGAVQRPPREKRLEVGGGNPSRGLRTPPAARGSLGEVWPRCAEQGCRRGRGGYGPTTRPRAVGPRGAGRGRPGRGGAGGPGSWAALWDRAQGACVLGGEEGHRAEGPGLAIRPDSRLRG